MVSLRTALIRTAGPLILLGLLGSAPLRALGADPDSESPLRAVDTRRAAVPSESPAPRGPLPLVRLEFVGLARTAAERAERATGLTLPCEASSERIQAAIARLRASRLFTSVEAHTRADSAAGGVVLVFDVRESRPVVRFGLGYEDFSSWYVIPAQLAFDNVGGRGLGASVGLRLGYRVAGLEATLRQPASRDARDFWEVRLGVDAIDRIYYLDSTETKHRIERGGLGLRAGRALSSAVALEGWTAFENVNVDSGAAVYSDPADGSRRRGDEIPFRDLPYEIRRDVRERPQSRLGVALLFDRRSGRGLETRGLWARVSGEGAFSKVGDFASWQADVRGYGPVARGVQLAARLRGASLSHQAPFYERYYAGGLYTVRGYASQSLSPPQGDLNLGCASVELRSAWLGSAPAPRLVAIAFVDAGASWSRGVPRLGNFASGVGFGFRLRVPWFGYLGLDAARPLSPSQVDEAFHVNGSIGWTF